MATPRKRTDTRLRMDDAPKSIQSIIRTLLEKDRDFTYLETRAPDGTASYRLRALPSHDENEVAVEEE